MAIEPRAGSDQLSLDQSSSVLLGLAFHLRLNFLCGKNKTHQQSGRLETEEVACGLAGGVSGTRPAEVALPCQVLVLPCHTGPLSHVGARPSHPHPLSPQAISVSRSKGQRLSREVAAATFFPSK